MDTFKSFESELYTVNDQSFADIALDLFRFQAANNPVYKAFLQHLSVNIATIGSLEDVPFLPITLFKQYIIKSGSWQPEVIFTSSGTTSGKLSQHAIQSLEFYLQHSRKCFEWFFGPITDYHFLALLPSYLERKGSSLIAMMDHFITHSQSPYSAFYHLEIEKLIEDIARIRHDDRKTILWGVSFALLEMAEKHNVDLSHVMIFETGGMKGRKKEITRRMLHDVLSGALHVDNIYAEYGMTELLSQAYTRGSQHFFCPPWMKVIGRELTDPLQKGLLNETGGINIIDLANWHSVAFIETEDLGIVLPDGSFEILGRIDNSDIRGCNLLID